MANLCSFSMLIKGTKDNIETFKNMMQQKGSVYMGRGASIEAEETSKIEDGLYQCEIDGSVKWSIQTALINDAKSQRDKPNLWYFHGVDPSTLTFVTLFEACEQLRLDMECYSEELGFHFQEHFIWKDNQLTCADCVDYSEEYDEEKDVWISSGGFEEWAFSI